MTLLVSKVRRVNHRQALGIRKPNPAVRGPAGHGLPLGMAGEFDGFQPVEHFALDVVRFPVREIIQALAAGPQNAAPRSPSKNSP